MVNLALIGVGKWGHHYLETAKSLNNLCKINYICTRDFKELFNYKDIQGIIIASPSSTHYSIAKDFLIRGQNLLIEKPFTTDYDQALELFKIWEKNKPKVLVGHVQLYNPAFDAVKKLIKELSIISINFDGLVSPPRSDTSVIWDWGPHPVALSLNLIKQPVIELSCQAKITIPGGIHYDTAIINLLFKNKVKANFNISWFGSEKKRKLTIDCNNQQIIFDDLMPEKKVQIIQDRESIYPSYDSQSPLYSELTEFVLAITKNHRITSDIVLGLEATKILSLCDKSASLGGKILPVSS